MNINELKPGEGEEVVGRVEAMTEDKLERVFLLQRYLHEKYKPIERGNDLYYPEKFNLDRPKDQEKLRVMFMRIIQELVEAAECLKSKAWKQTHVITDQDHFKEELIDALHFYIELCLCVGIEANDLYEIYTKKMRINNWRIGTKY